MSAKYYEEREYYLKEYERTNGVEREMVDQEFRSQGRPFESRLSSTLRDLPPPLSRFDDDFESRRREFRSFFDRDRRQHSLPPRRSFYPASSSTLGRTFSPPRTTTTSTNHRQDYQNNKRSDYSNISSNSYPYAHVPAAPASTLYQHPESRTSTLYQPPVTEIYRKSPEIPRSTFPTTTNLSRPGSPQTVAGAGDIINTENGFTIQLDVKHFEPHDIKVSLTGSNLSIIGERIEDDPITSQQVKRSFSRRYAIPDDIRLESIKSHMTDTGVLIVRGNRRTWRQTDINVHVDYAPISDV